MDTAQRDRLARLIEGIDINSADGRAGLRTLLREVEAAAPAVFDSVAAEMLLARLPLRAA